MASSRKPRSAELAAAVPAALRGSLPELRGKRVLVGLSGGIDSVVLLHVLARELPPPQLRAAHVHHGLSPNADGWARFCRTLCRRLGVTLSVRKVKVQRSGAGLEAAARKARYEALKKLGFDVLALAHQLDDQAETVLMNLLRGAGPRGASGMPARARLEGRELVRPLLGVPREAIVAYARANGLEWIEDESNANVELTRNFLRHRVGPLLAERFPAWRQSLARAAGLFARHEADAGELVREFLRAQGLRAPSEARLAEMLKQLASGSHATRIEHDGAVLRVFRGDVVVEPDRAPQRFEPLAWRGERRLALPALGGELVFRRAHGEGIDAKWIAGPGLSTRLRSGGERLQLDARRPRRTLKNLFQEAGVPPWQRARLPLLYREGELVWVPGLGTDVRYRASPGSRGWVPEWRVTC